MTKLELKLPKLYERDLDVIISEELMFNPNVCALIASKLEISDGIQISKCELSYYDVTGETDLIATGKSGNDDILLLIENKIDATFQPNQPQRYKERAAAFKDSRGYQKTFCVLVAPTRFLETSKEQSTYFDIRISYEELAEAVAAENNLRASHRSELISRSVAQAHSTYIVIPAPEVTNLWMRVYTIAKSEFPKLDMREPKMKGSYSSWIILKADLPPNVTIDWKIPVSKVDLCFYKAASKRPTSSLDLSSLPLGSHIENIGNTKETLAIRAPVSDAPKNWIDVSDEKIREALNVAEQLLNFFHQTFPSS